MEVMYKLVLIVWIFAQPFTASVHIQVDFNNSEKNMTKLPRFWTNTGFAPPEPINDVRGFFESVDVNLNLEIIGSLPNRGIENVRIHWLLNLLSISNYSESTNVQPLPIFNFYHLDNFLGKLTSNYRLNPTIEFMTNLKFRKMNDVTWESIAYQLVSRYIGRYGSKQIKKWKFETWNEPDLKSYNVLNFTDIGYSEYLIGIKNGIEAAARQYSLSKIELRGPAGLFKNEKKHPFCWGVLSKCNEFPDNCPIDIITFHRKGNGNSADEILSGSLELLEEFSEKFPNLTSLKYSNSEADPIKKWSEPRDFQADCRYAATLVDTVFQHWQAIRDGRLANLDSISHDNSFLNFYPNFFTQRTLLARFQMNNTSPKHVQYVQKPVFASLGLLSSAASHAGNVTSLKNSSVSFIITINNNSRHNFYSCIILWSHVNLNEFTNKSRTFEIQVQGLNDETDQELFYISEGIDNKRTNPWLIHTISNSPAFPDINLFKKLRNAHNPVILEQPTKVSNGKILLNLQLMPPFVMTIRICSKKNDPPKKVRNLRIHRVNSEEIILFWSDRFYQAKCIKTYEIFFKYSTENEYIQIETPHLPFLYHQFKHTIPGCFKVRSMDIFDRTSGFSRKICTSNT